MTEEKKTVLFICVHNSARSQLAEALLNKYGGDFFQAESAGLEAGALNPVVIEILRLEENIDIAAKKTRRVMDLWRAGRLYYAVITVCSAAEEKGCPVFPGITHRLSWPFEDPGRFTGSESEIMAKTIALKAEIKKKILEFIETHR